MLPSVPYFCVSTAIPVDSAWPGGSPAPLKPVSGDEPCVAPWLHAHLTPVYPRELFHRESREGKEEPVWGIFFFFFILFPLLSDSAAAAIVNDVLKMELLFSIGGKKPSLSWLPTGSTSHSEGSGWGGYLAVSSSSLMSKAWEFHKQIARQLHPTQVGDGRTNC